MPALNAACTGGRGHACGLTLYLELVCNTWKVLKKKLRYVKGACICFSDRNSVIKLSDVIFPHPLCFSLFPPLLSLPLPSSALLLHFTSQGYFKRRASFPERFAG